MNITKEELLLVRNAKLVMEKSNLEFRLQIAGLFVAYGLNTSASINEDTGEITTVEAAK